MYEYTFKIAGYIVCKFGSDFILSTDEMIEGFIRHNDLGISLELVKIFSKTFVFKSGSVPFNVEWNREYIPKYVPEK